MKRSFLGTAALLALAACTHHDSDGHQEDAGHHEHADGHAEDEFERGMHRGRLLEDGDFALEVTIFEANVPPQFRLYAYQGGELLDPVTVDATIELHRLGGDTDRFTFEPDNDYLRGSGTVEEPHSFDVTVTARHGAAVHEWSYASYEGRTTIPRDVAREAGIEVAVAGPALIRDTVRLMGTVAIDANRHASVRARFPGVVREVRVVEGEQVSRGQTLALIEGNESLRTYALAAPFDGVVLSMQTSVGDLAGENVLFEVADLSSVWVDLRAIGSDAGKLRPGQAVQIQAATGPTQGGATIRRLLPVASAGQGTIARVHLANPDRNWLPGMTVAAEVTVDSREVPLAVRESGLQRFRDFTVVFAQVGDTYEVRMLELGARDGEFAEVLQGLEAGTTYVSEQSFLIRADIEKSGASHDH